MKKRDAKKVKEMRVILERQRQSDQLWNAEAHAKCLLGVDNLLEGGNGRWTSISGPLLERLVKMAQE